MPKYEYTLVELTAKMTIEEIDQLITDRIALGDRLLYQGTVPMNGAAYLCFEKVLL